MKSQNLPLIPYLGIFLTDITYLYTASESISPLDSQKDCENKNLNEIFETISRFQTSNYGYFCFYSYFHLEHFKIIPILWDYLNIPFEINSSHSQVDDELYQFFYFFF